MAKAAEDVELVKGANGVFEVFADGKLVFLQEGTRPLPDRRRDRRPRRVVQLSLNFR